VKEYLEATEDALVAAGYLELEVFGGEKAEGFDEAKDVEVAWG